MSWTDEVAHETSNRPLNNCEATANGQKLPCAQKLSSLAFVSQ